MHIPDGFLDARTCVGTYCLAGGGLAWAMRKVSAQWNERTVPLLGVMAAFIFAGQMVNFPVAGATSGHLFGGVLAAAFLGPYGAMVVLAAVLVVQCFLFQDGGVTALGANLTNLGLIGIGVGYGFYRFLSRLLPGHRGRVVAGAVAGGISVMAAAAACAFELAGSGTISLKIVLPSMLGVHLFIGVGEGLITAAILSFVLQVRPDLIYQPGKPPESLVSGSWKTPLWAGTAAAFGVAVLLSPLASSSPDGLEVAAEGVGLAERATAIFESPMVDYVVPQISGWMSGSVAAMAGTAAAFGLAWGVAKVLRRSPSRTDVE